MEKLKSKEQFQEQIQQPKTICLFSADWCPDCRFIEPFLPQVEEMFTQYTFVLVDRDEFIDICQEYDVFGIPSFIAFQNGKEVGRFVSKDRKTKQEIIQFIESLPD
ncbi:thioredoxin family protein [Virgibacillus sp. 179-BFC.A HS]|uniref:Thioredoxin family protein n=1 Tax=Tigheibacillus jepli TaxID=3035914 RepID=A0ABU5CG57_9BACI|nr:thioredoxin family protein [Virgibacillus sp. 179-BFC.A HS]MDY0405304.1 thioredoxin family protein [Virgibacillus sp. 179-BFC.A HS]